MDDSIEMTTKHGEPKRLAVFEDMIMVTPSFQIDFKKQMEYVKELSYMEGDILLCSYPKCGTHWLGALVRGLMKKSADEPDRPRPWLLEHVSAELVNGLDAPRMFTTHLTPKRLPESIIQNRCKIVLILRNPKDVAVSYFHHLKNSVSFSNPQDWDEFFESFIAGKVPWGSYFYYLKQWEEAIKQSKDGNSSFNVEYIYFEDLKKNVIEGLRKLNQHIGYKKSDEELMQISNYCTFNEMAERSKADKGNIPKPFIQKDGTSLIYRKGDIGDWKNHFTVAQNEIFDKITNSCLRDSIFKFKYE